MMYKHTVLVRFEGKLIRKGQKSGMSPIYPSLFLLLPAQTINMMVRVSAVILDHEVKTGVMHASSLQVGFKDRRSLW